MAVKIRLKRLGKVRVPQYRIVVVDSRKKRDGKVIEEIGTYQPKDEPSVITVVSDRAQYWLGVGAQPTETVQTLLSVTGDWQKFKGLPGTEGRLRTAEEKRSKLDIFNEALKEAGSEGVEATTAKSKKSDAKKDDAKKDDSRKDDAKKDEPAAEPAAEAAAATPGVETPEGATEQAEVEETKALDDEKQQEPEDGAKGNDDGKDGPVS